MTNYILAYSGGAGSHCTFEHNFRRVHYLKHGGLHSPRRPGLFAFGACLACPALFVFETRLLGTGSVRVSRLQSSDVRPESDNNNRQTKPSDSGGNTDRTAVRSLCPCSVLRHSLRISDYVLRHSLPITLVADFVLRRSNVFGLRSLQM